MIYNRDMSIANYVAPMRQHQINQLLEDILLKTEKSYPEDNLLGIIKSYIPAIEVIEHDFNEDRSIRGAIYKKSNEFIRPLIVIQQRIKKEAKSFALAHEFAHYVLNHPGDANYMIDKMDFDDSKEMQKEAEAQYFAGALLMPLEKFTKLMGIMSVSQLAQRFGVSESAVKVRKAWLNGTEREETI